MRDLVPARRQLGADPAVEVALVRLEGREEEAHVSGRAPFGAALETASANARARRARARSGASRRGYQRHEQPRHGRGQLLRPRSRQDGAAARLAYERLGAARRRRDHGTPQASASAAAIPKPSCREGRTKSAASRRCSATIEGTVPGASTPSGSGPGGGEPTRRTGRPGRAGGQRERVEQEPRVLARVVGPADEDEQRPLEVRVIRRRREAVEVDRDRQDPDRRARRARPPARPRRGWRRWSRRPRAAPRITLRSSRRSSGRSGAGPRRASGRETGRAARRLVRARPAPSQHAYGSPLRSARRSRTAPSVADDPDRPVPASCGPSTRPESRRLSAVDPGERDATSRACRAAGSPGSGARRSGARLVGRAPSRRRGRPSSAPRRRRRSQGPCRRPSRSSHASHVPVDRLLACGHRGRRVRLRPPPRRPPAAGRGAPRRRGGARAPRAPPRPSAARPGRPRSRTSSAIPACSLTTTGTPAADRLGDDQRRSSRSGRRTRGRRRRRRRRAPSGRSSRQAGTTCVRPASSGVRLRRRPRSPSSRDRTGPTSATCTSGQARRSPRRAPRSPCRRAIRPT